jgi:hypothetical protein
LYIIRSLISKRSIAGSAANVTPEKWAPIIMACDANKIFINLKTQLLDRKLYKILH